MIIPLCPTCIDDVKVINSSSNKIKFLRYVDIKGNTTQVIDNMYKKDPRPNFHVEMGFSDSPDSPDRFDAFGYNEVVRKIQAAPLFVPENIDDVRQRDGIVDISPNMDDLIKQMKGR